jgi:hypothetical protein
MTPLKDFVKSLLKLSVGVSSRTIPSIFYNIETLTIIQPNMFKPSDIGFVLGIGPCNTIIAKDK